MGEFKLKIFLSGKYKLFCFSIVKSDFPDFLWDLIEIYSSINNFIKIESILINLLNDIIIFVKNSLQCTQKIHQYLKNFVTMV